MLVCLQDDWIIWDSASKSNWCLLLFDIGYQGERWCNLSTYQRFWPETLWWREAEGIRLGGGWFFLGFYGISVNQTGPWHELHHFPGHFGYQITSHLVNLPVGCHQKTLILYLHRMICSPFAKSLSGIGYFRYRMIRLHYCLEALRILCCSVCQNKLLL